MKNGSMKFIIVYFKRFSSRIVQSTFDIDTTYYIHVLLCSAKLSSVGDHEFDDVYLIVCDTFVDIRIITFN